MVTSEINIISLLPKTLDTREASDRLFNEVSHNYPNSTKIELDFDGVEFMSRNFADQFHKNRLKFQLENNVLIELKNAEFQIIEILDAVSRTQTFRKENKIDINFLSFSNINIMEDYIYAW